MRSKQIVSVTLICGLSFSALGQSSENLTKSNAFPSTGSLTNIVGGQPSAGSARSNRMDYRGEPVDLVVGVTTKSNKMSRGGSPIDLVVEASTPPLDETLAWIKNKLDTWSLPYADNMGRMHHETVSFDNLGNIINRDEWKEAGGNIKWRENRAQLSDFSFADIGSGAPVNSENFASVTLKASRKIVKTYGDDSGKPNVAETPRQDFMTFSIIDARSAERVTKAFNHAIALAHEKEPF